MNLSLFAVIIAKYWILHKNFHFKLEHKRQSVVGVSHLSFSEEVADTELVWAYYSLYIKVQVCEKITTTKSQRFSFPVDENYIRSLNPNGQHL